MLTSLPYPILLLSIATTALAYRCPDDLKQCSCETSECGGYSFSCPPYNRSLVAQFCQSELVVQCTDQGERYFTSLRDFNYHHVTSLKFSSCHLSESTSKTLEGYMSEMGPKLRRLEFITNRDLKSSLNTHFLSKSPNLSHLALSSNNLMSIPDDLLRNAPHLIGFTLQDKTIESLPSSLFSYTHKIKGIELGINSLKSLPQNIFNGLNELVHLNLEGNQLRSIFKQHLSLPNLTVLDLHSNNLSILQPDVFINLTNLQTLNLFGNRLTNLPDQIFSANQRLSILKLNRNRLTTIGINLFKGLNRLEQLFLHSNAISNINHGTFDDLYMLKNLTLDNNKLSSLPKNIFSQLANLTFLDLSYNNLTTLSATLFQRNPQLQYLKINYNNISTIAEEVFESLLNLVHLELRHNHIKGFPVQTFAHNRHLHYIDASFNQLSFNYTWAEYYTVSSPFHYCPDLQHILVSHNNYNMIANDWIQSMLYLETLDLRYNNFTSLSADQLTFVSYKTVKLLLEHNNINMINIKSVVNITDIKREDIEVTLNNNPISCNCIMYYFQRFMSDLSPRDLIKFHINNLVCDKPQNLKGMLVTRVNPCDFKCHENLESECPSSCHCYYQTCSQNFVVNCANANLTTLPKLYSDPNTVLHLEHNQITDLQVPPDYNYSHVKSIHLSHNHLSNINLTFDAFLNLESLYLDHNNFTIFPSNLKSLFEYKINKSQDFNVSLGDNPWTCSCETLNLYRFVIKYFNNITDYEDIVCNGTSMVVINSHIDNFCPPYSRALLIASIIIVSIAGMLCTVIAIMYYRYGVTLKIWMFAHHMCLPCITEADVDSDKVYDAFISYSHKDEEFIVKELAPQLEEKEPQFKLCLHYRDWVIGANIQEQIVDSVETSKRTVIVLSSNFLQSEWGKLEFRAAHRQALQDNIERVIMIVYGDVPPKEEMGKDLCMYINTKTYLKWDDPWFWEKLRWALPHPQHISRPRFFRKSVEDNLELVENEENSV